MDGVSDVRWPGFSGMVSFRHPDATRIAAACEVFSLAESLGGVESLIEVPQAMTHQSVEGSGAAVPADLVRLSCGIEAAEDLVEDLARAIGAPSPSELKHAAGRPISQEMRFLLLSLTLLAIAAPSAAAYPKLPQPLPPVKHNPADRLAALPIEDSSYDGAGEVQEPAQRRDHRAEQLARREHPRRVLGLLPLREVGQALRLAARREPRDRLAPGRRQPRPTARPPTSSSASCWRPTSSATRRRSPVAWAWRS